MDAIVIGAGPGGCAAAWHLRKLGWEVLLVERRRYPADKLCGEFLSYDGVACIERMGLVGALQGIGEWVEQVQISGVDGTCWRAPLPAPGLGVSRRVLDATLAEACQGLGVAVEFGVQVRDIEVGGDGYVVRGRRGEQYGGRLVVAACGRQGGLFAEPRGAWLALQVRGARLAQAVELHGFPGGYAGLCAIEGQRATLGLLTTAEAFRAAGGTAEAFAARVMRQNPVLADQLDRLQPLWAEQQAVAALRFGRGRTSRGGALLVGDAAGSINPLCGDGMSMALRGGELLAPLADRRLRGEWAAEQLAAAWDRAWHREFRRRMWLGRMLERVLLRANWTRRTLKLFQAWPGLGQAALRLSRG